MHLNHDVYLREQQASQALLVKPRSTPSGLRPVSTSVHGPSPQGRAFHQERPDQK